MRLNAGPGGTYRVDAGLEVTVVTAARLPSGWTRFYLDQSPLGNPPVSARQLIGTTYSFTVSDEAPAATTVTYHLKQAKPFIRPRPDGKPHIGATVVETEFEVKDCSSGIAVTNPATNAELVADCEALLGLRDTIQGTARLNWTAGKAMSEWMGVTVSGTPQRVTALNLADLGLDGGLSGVLGNLTGLTTLNLGGNALTGRLPSKLTLMTNLTSVTLDSTFEGCAPSGLTTASGLAACGEPTSTWDLQKQAAMPGGTFEFKSGDDPAVVFDVPENSGLIFVAARHTSFAPGTEPVHSGELIILRNAERTLSFAIDLEWVGNSISTIYDDFTSSGTASGLSRVEYEAILKRIADSIWVKED